MQRRFGEIVGRVALALAVFGAGPALADAPADEMGALFRQILADPTDTDANLAAADGAARSARRWPPTSACC